MDRLHDLARFYGLLDRLQQRIGGTRRFADTGGRGSCPQRGVYFFFEPGEHRSDSGGGPRVVRVGTHALTNDSQSTLWQRLSQHRGTVSTKGGNHRASIFRLLVGAALEERRAAVPVPSWGHKPDLMQAARHFGESVGELRRREHDVEVAVSVYLRAMPFVWVTVLDPPGAASRRGCIERNAIALLSNWNKLALDPPSSEWLGLASDRERVRGSGLWNNRHVEEQYDPAFLATLEECIAATDRSVKA